MTTQNTDSYAVGSRVACTIVTSSFSRYRPTHSIESVVRLTETQVVLADGSRYRKASGEEVGGYRCITPLTAELEDKIKAQIEVWNMRNEAIEVLDRLVPRISSRAMTPEQMKAIAQAAKDCGAV